HFARVCLLGQRTQLGSTCQAIRQPRSFSRALEPGRSLPSNRDNPLGAITCLDRGAASSQNLKLVGLDEGICGVARSATFLSLRRVDLVSGPEGLDRIGPARAMSVFTLCQRFSSRTKLHIAG